MRRPGRHQAASAASRLASTLLALSAMAAGALIITAPGDRAAAEPGAIPTTNATGARAAPAVTAGADPAPTATPAPTLPVVLSLTDIAPAALTPDTELTVTGTLRNTGGSALTALQLNLRLNWELITDRRELAAWSDLSPADPQAGTLWETLTLAEPLAAGATAPFTISGRGDSTQLPATAAAFGPRRLSVEVQQGPGPALHRVGIVRSFTVWNPVPQYTATRLAVLVPITSGADPIEGLGTASSATPQWQPDGRLSRLLTATGDPVISYAVDPALLVTAQQAATAQNLGPTGVPSPGLPSGQPSSPPVSTAPTGPAGSGPPGTMVDPRTGQEAGRFLDQFRAARGSRDLLTLPYGDPDVAALAHARQPAVLDAADADAAASTAEIFGDQLPGGLVWPASGQVDAGTATLAASGTRRSVVVATPTATLAAGSASVHGAVSLANGQADALLTDPTISAAVAGAGVAGGALSTQRLLAETAAITAAHPTEPYTVLAVTPRGWNPEPSAAQNALIRLRSASWVSVEKLSAVRGSPAVTIPRSAVPAAVTAETGELPATHVRAVAAQLARLNAFAPALTETGRQQLLAPVRRWGLSTVSVAWAGRQQRLATARTDLTEQVDYFYRSVTVRPGSRVNLLSRSGQLPVTVANALDTPVDVVLTLHPTSARIQITDPVRVRVDAGRDAAVLVPSTALANGDAQIEITLTAPASTPGATGTVLSNGPIMTVGVHSDWEGQGLTWIGVGLLVLLIWGLIRSVRSGRERVNPDTVPDPDDVGRDPEPVRAAPTNTRSAAAGPTVLGGDHDG